MRLLVIAALAVLLLVTPAAAVPRFGVYSEDGLSGDWEGAAAQRAAGVEVVRFPMTWKYIEPQRGVFTWERFDSAVLLAARNGLRVVPFIVGPPSWATGVPDSSPMSEGVRPLDIGDLERFATAAVDRYGPNGTLWQSYPDWPAVPIRAWQVHNEPNLPTFWRPAPSAAGYVNLLRTVGAAIHAADPGAQVIAAGLPNSSAGIPIKLYLEQMYAAGAQGTFDALAVHAYAPDATGVLAAIKSARDVADANGDAEVPIWVTEFGWASAGVDSSLTTNEAGQAALIKETIEGLRTYGDAWDVNTVLYFNWRDTQPPPGARDIWPYNTGLLRRDGTAKPALAAFRAAIRGGDSGNGALPAQDPVDGGSPGGEAGAGPEPEPDATGGGDAPSRLDVPGLRLTVRLRQAGGRLRGRLGCSHRCEASLVLIAHVPRRGPRPAHVSGRWNVVAGSRAQRRLDLRLQRVQRSWLRAHPQARLVLSVAAITRAGAVSTERLTIA